MIIEHTYNPNEPKKSDSAFIKGWTPFTVSRFYGTDINGKSTSYFTSISNAMQERIIDKHDVVNFGSDLFKPFSDRPLFLGHCILVAIDAGLIAAAALGNPYLLIAYICWPAVRESLVAIISLCRGIDQSIKGNHSSAAEYYLDATTRFVLVVPLFIANTLLLPYEIISFLTHSIGSLAQWAGVKELPALEDASPDLVEEWIDMNPSNRKPDL